MRKITEEAMNAFYGGRHFKKQNTEVRATIDYVYLVLHNSVIAKLNDKGLWVTTAGWDTNTTRDRLNGLHGVHVRSRKGVLTLNGKPWDGGMVEVGLFNTYEL